MCVCALAIQQYNPPPPPRTQGPKDPRTQGPKDHQGKCVCVGFQGAFSIQHSAQEGFIILQHSANLEASFFRESDRDFLNPQFAEVFLIKRSQTGGWSCDFLASIWWSDRGFSPQCFGLGFSHAEGIGAKTRRRRHTDTQAIQPTRRRDSAQEGFIIIQHSAFSAGGRALRKRT